MLPLAFFLQLTCADLRDTELQLAERQAVLVSRLEARHGERWVRDAWEKELLYLVGTLDDVDTAKYRKGCK